MSAPDKLTNEQVAPYGWVELKTSGAGLPTVLYSEGKAYVPAKREPRVWRGRLGELIAAGGDPFPKSGDDPMVEVTEILEEETP